jgi:hypothetical protein
MSADSDLMTSEEALGLMAAVITDARFPDEYQIGRALGSIVALWARIETLEAPPAAPEWLSQALNEGDGVYRP